MTMCEAVLLAVVITESVALAYVITRWRVAQAGYYSFGKYLDLASHHPMSKVVELTRADYTVC